MSGDGRRRWWLEPFGLPPRWEQRLAAGGVSEFTRVEVVSLRICLVAFPMLAVAAGVLGGQWGGLGGALFPWLQLTMQPRHLRRQVLGLRPVGPPA
jgi:hypothetical protein